MLCWNRSRGRVQRVGNEEAIKVIGLLTTYFPGRLQEESVASWALEILSYNYADGIAGAREHGRTAEHPSLAGLIAGIEAERRRRCDRMAQDLGRKALTTNATPDLEQQARSRAARDAAIAQVLGRVSVPTLETVEPKTWRPNGHTQQTEDQAEARRKLLREQAGQLAREEAE